MTQALDDLVVPYPVLVRSVLRAVDRFIAENAEHVAEVIVDSSNTNDADELRSRYRGEADGRTAALADAMFDLCGQVVANTVGHASKAEVAAFLKEQNRKLGTPGDEES